MKRASPAYSGIRKTEGRVSDEAKRLVALRLVSPTKWRAEVRRALSAVGSTTLAAERLGVSRRLLATWVSDGVADGLSLRGRGRPKNE
jgi:hypothetical protein